MRTRFRNQGFSLVELMVAVVIGMLALIFVTRTMVTFEANRRESTGGSDSLQNGIVALFTLENEASQAGWGLNHDQVSGCNLTFNDTSGYAMPTVGAMQPFAPIVVNFSAAVGDPDTINFFSGSSPVGAGSLPLFSDATVGANSIVLMDAVGFGFNVNDVFVIAQPSVAGGNNACTIVQSVAAPVAGVVGPTSVVTIDLTSGRFTPPGGIPALIPNNANRTRVFNLGPANRLAFHTWSVVNGRLVLRATDIAGASATAQPAVSNIVSIKALYGFDTTLPAAFNPQAPMQVNVWSRSMIDADFSGVAGDSGDYQRVSAIRLAVVARSREPEKIPTSGTCTATTTLPRVFQSQEPVGVTTVPIDVNVAVAGDAIPWQCYHYKAFETIVPVRNVGWRPRT